MTFIPGIWNILTLNVNRMRSAYKALALKDFLVNARYHVVFLQEVTREALLYLLDFTDFTVIDNVLPDDSVGTAILVKSDIPILNIDILPNGRGIAVNIYGVHFIKNVQMFVKLMGLNYGVISP